MKRKAILVILLFILILIAVISVVPFTKQIAVKINAPYFNSYNQVVTIQNWKKWDPDVKNTFTKDSSLYKLINDEITIPGESFRIKQSSSNTLSIAKQLKGNTFNYSLTILPGKDGLFTTIIVTFKTTVLKSLLPAYQDRDLKNTAVYDFKQFMEDVKQYYGFPIRSSFIKEKKIIVKKENIAARNIYTSISQMQTELHDYVLTKHLVQQGPVMAQYNTLQGDSLQVMVGIPVDKEVAAGNGFLYMYMPATRVVIGDFKERYQDKKNIYKAMGDYVHDKFLQTKIAPYEVFLDKLPTSNNDVVNMEVNNPVF